MRIAYYRVSTGDQSIEAQRQALGDGFDKEFKDEGVSGGVLAADRPGFAKLLEQVRKGDTVYVYAVDRLGRDALDVQTSVRRLIDAGVTVDIHGLGPIARGVGEIILAVLAQVADMERRKIKERTEAGRAAARVALEATGRTHRGKESLGRPKRLSAAVVATWRRDNKASIKATARHFAPLSEATVKRYCAEVAAANASDPLEAFTASEIIGSSPQPSPAEKAYAPSDNSFPARIARRREARAAEVVLPSPDADPDHDPLNDL
jgi:putative DNA-invertase from lambdoid prophage Rac